MPNRRWWADWKLTLVFIVLVIGMSIQAVFVIWQQPRANAEMINHNAQKIEANHERIIRLEQRIKMLEEKVEKLASVAR